MYLLTLIIMITATIGQASSASAVRGFSFAAWLVIWRFLLGFGIGGDYPVSFFCFLFSRLCCSLFMEGIGRERARRESERVGKREIERRKHNPFPLPFLRAHFGPL